MGLALTGNVSLTQVRQDLGLTGAGSMREKSVVDKANATANGTGNNSLLSYRGNVAGLQLTFITGNVPSSTLVHTSGQQLYGGGGTASYNSALNSIETSGTTRTAGGYDTGSRACMVGICSQTGAYKLTGNVAVAKSVWNTPQANYWILVTGYSVGFGSGGSSSHLSKLNNQENTGNYTFDYDLNLDISYPYVVVFLVCDAKGGSTTNVTVTYNWTNVLLRKV